MTQLSLLFVVLLASVVTMPLERRTGVPLPVLMTVSGLVMARVPPIPSVKVAPKLILPLVLPPRIFAVASRASRRDLKANIRSVLLVAVARLVVTTTVVGGVLHWVVPALPVAAAVALGALVSPPDP
ncbi:cation:proton antiporter domain-containing protein, partial [Saccharothrix sp. ST-888]|uniref:cation:proton antiporter domain-containing protein n=1 Tax=Saccharothrix sp. ST-888 TaxID=1427391 RepID=UPI0005ED3F69